MLNTSPVNLNKNSSNSNNKHYNPNDHWNDNNNVDIIDNNNTNNNDMKQISTKLVWWFFEKGWFKPIKRKENKSINKPSQRGQIEKTSFMRFFFMYNSVFESLIAMG